MTESRAQAMAGSVLRAAKTAGYGGEALERITRANAVAMVPRVDRLADDHHPAYLHPGRSVVVLLRDVGPCTADALVLAALLESEDESLRLDEQALDALGDDVVGLLPEIPGPADPALAEYLVTAAPEVVLAMLAERLDQLRHLHLREDLVGVWRERHEEAGRVWLPVAERTHERLATRFAHWSRTFARRL